MKHASPLLRLAAATALGMAAFIAALILFHQFPGHRGAVLAQSSASVVELEDSLFIVDPHFKNAKGVGAIDVIWIPEPIQKYCLGKAFDTCSAIDFCIRTTTKSVPMCQKLPASLRNLPPYPAGTNPPRMFSITFTGNAPQIPGFDTLRQFYDSAPAGTLDRISTHAKIRAKVRLTGGVNNGNFQLLEVLEAPSN